MSDREEYTPTMDEIKRWYAGAVDEYRCDTGMSADEAEAAFDRAIAAHDKALRREYGERISDLIERISIAPYLAPRAIGLLETMRERAARIARGKDQTDE